MTRFCRRSVASVAIAAAFALIAVLSFFTTPAEAQRSLECQQVWTGASKDNDIVDCLKNLDRVGSQWKYYVYPGFAAVIFLFTLLGVPIIFCCRCCCCDTCCTSCTRTSNPTRSRLLLWMWVIIAVIFACCVCVLIVYGSVLMVNTASDGIDQVRYGALGSVNDTKNLAVTYFTDYSTVPPTPPPVDLAVFDDVVNEIGDKIGTFKDDYFKYFRIAEIVACCVGCVGIVLALFIVPFACCRCGGCGPVCFSALFWFFGFIFALLAVLFTVGLYASGAACGELTLQYKREPGLLQWYLVPWCDSEFGVASTREEVKTTVADEVQKGCQELLNYCDNNPVYDPAVNANKVFVCGKGLTAASQCTSLDYLVEVITDSYVKPNLASAVCANNPGQTFLEKCTVEDCAERCIDIAVPNIQAKTWSGEVWNATMLAANMSIGLSIVYPLLDCNYIMDLVGSAVEQGSDVTEIGFDKYKTITSCSQLHTSMVMLGTGFFVGALLFLLGIYILHHGSWMWVAKASNGKSVEGSDGSSSNGSKKKA